MRQYFDFTGRARRTELWMFILFNMIAVIVLVALDNMFGLSTPGRPTQGALSGLYSLAVTVPTWAVGARRPHDIGRRGWWQLLAALPLLSVILVILLPGAAKVAALVPLAGIVVLVVWWATPGKPEVNQWGANPKLVPEPFRVR